VHKLKSQVYYDGDRFKLPVFRFEIQEMYIVYLSDKFERICFGDLAPLRC
jgi:hypothetical protein